MMGPSETNSAVAPAHAVLDDSPPHGLSTTTKTFLSLVVAHMMIDCFGGIWPVFKKLAGLNLEWAGLIFFATSLIAMAMQPLFGLWADWGQRRLLIIIGAVMVCTAMFLGTVGRYPSFALDRTGYLVMALILLTVKMGQAMFHPAGASLAGGLSERRRSTFVSVFIAGGMLGFAASQGLFSLVYTTTNGHSELLLVVGMLVVAGVVVWCRPLEERDVTHDNIWKTLMALRPIWVQLLLLYLLLSLLSGLHAGLIFLLPEFLEARDYPPWMIYGGGIALITSGAVIVIVPAGYLADRVGRRKLMLLFLTVSVAMYFTMVLLPTLPLPGFMVLCLLTGGGLGATSPLGIALGQSLSPRHQSLISGVLMGLAWALGSVSTWITGHLAMQPSIGVIGALAWLGVGGIAAIIFMIALTGTRVQPY